MHEVMLVCPVPSPSWPGFVAEGAKVLQEAKPKQPMSKVEVVAVEVMAGQNTRNPRPELEKPDTEPEQPEPEKPEP